MVLFQIFCWMLEFYFTAVWIKNYLFLKKEITLKNRDGTDAESFSASFKNSSPREKVGKLSSFWDWWAESLFVSIIVAKYIIFPRANNGRSREKKNFWRSDLLTLSACTIGILSTLTYTEFDCAALLAMLLYWIDRWRSVWTMIIMRWNPLKE